MGKISADRSAAIWTLCALVNNYTMLIQCYQGPLGTPADDYCYNLASKLGGWATLRVDVIWFFVPEHRAGILILAHGQLERRACQDYFL